MEPVNDVWIVSHASRSSAAASHCNTGLQLQRTPFLLTSFWAWRAITSLLSPPPRQGNAGIKYPPKVRKALEPKSRAQKPRPGEEMHPAIAAEGPFFSPAKGEGWLQSKEKGSDAEKMRVRASGPTTGPSATCRGHSSECRKAKVGKKSQEHSRLIHMKKFHCIQLWMGMRSPQNEENWARAPGEAEAQQHLKACLYSGAFRADTSSSTSVCMLFRLGSGFKSSITALVYTVNYKKKSNRGYSMP